MLFLPRSWWADHPSREPRVALDQRTRLVVHHTATAPSTFRNLTQVRYFMLRLQAMRPELFKREPDVPYNLVALFVEEPLRQVILVEGVGLDRRGAHISGANTESLGLAFAGTFASPPWGRDLDLPSALRDTLGWVSTAFGRRLPVSGHRDHKATDCPGDALYRALAAYKKEEI